MGASGWIVPKFILRVKKTEEPEQGKRI